MISLRRYRRHVTLGVLALLAVSGTISIAMRALFTTIDLVTTPSPTTTPVTVPVSTPPPTPTLTPAITPAPTTIPTVTPPPAPTPTPTVPTPVPPPQPQAPQCGDGACEGSEHAGSCPRDCGASPVPTTPTTAGIRCGDTICNGSEDPMSCPRDCPLHPAPPAPTPSPAGPYCGDRICNGMENGNTCPRDCQLARPSTASSPVHAPAQTPLARVVPIFPVRAQLSSVSTTVRRIAPAFARVRSNLSSAARMRGRSQCDSEPCEERDVCGLLCNRQLGTIRKAHMRRR